MNTDPDRPRVTNGQKIKALKVAVRDLEAEVDTHSTEIEKLWRKVDENDRNIRGKLAETNRRFLEEQPKPADISALERRIEWLYAFIEQEHPNFYLHNDNDCFDEDGEEIPCPQPEIPIEQTVAELPTMTQYRDALWIIEGRGCETHWWGHDQVPWQHCCLTDGTRTANSTAGASQICYPCIAHAALNGIELR